MVKEELETAFTVILHVKPLGLSHVEKEKKEKKKERGIKIVMDHTHATL